MKVKHVKFSGLMLSKKSTLGEGEITQGGAEGMAGTGSLWDDALCGSLVLAR